MHYNFNVYFGRKLFNLNYQAKDDEDAVAQASRLIPKFMDLRWVLWSCPGGDAEWERGIENPGAARRLWKAK
jgi:hypothetical protein